MHAATMAGRHAAAERAVTLGYAIEADPGPSGKLGHWRLTGIPDEVLTLFSKRSAEIDEATDPDGFDSYRSRGMSPGTPAVGSPTTTHPTSGVPGGRS